jgi:hypothetical protein
MFVVKMSVLSGFTIRVGLARFSSEFILIGFLMPTWEPGGLTAMFVLSWCSKPEAEG